MLTFVRTRSPTRTRPPLRRSVTRRRRPPTRYVQFLPPNPENPVTQLFRLHPGREQGEGRQGGGGRGRGVTLSPSFCFVTLASGSRRGVPRLPPSPGFIPRRDFSLPCLTMPGPSPLWHLGSSFLPFMPPPQTLFVIPLFDHSAVSVHLSCNCADLLPTRPNQSVALYRVSVSRSSRDRRAGLYPCKGLLSIAGRAPPPDLVLRCVLFQLSPRAVRDGPTRMLVSRRDQSFSNPRNAGPHRDAAVRIRRMGEDFSRDSQDTPPQRAGEARKSDIANNTS